MGEPANTATDDLLEITTVGIKEFVIFLEMRESFHKKEEKPWLQMEY